MSVMFVMIDSVLPRLGWRKNVQLTVRRRMQDRDARRHIRLCAGYCALVEAPGPQPVWSPIKWRAIKAELFPRFRSLTDDVPVLSAEIRAFLDARRRADAPLSVLDFGGGSGELVGAAVRPQDHHVIIESGDDRATVLAGVRESFDALIFSHVLAYFSDPIGLLAELAAYSQPRAGWLAIVLDDTGTQAEICREAAKTDARFLNHFGQARTLAPLLDAAGIRFSSHTIETRAVARSQDDLLTVVSFYLDGVIDELTERLASTIPPEPNGEYILTMDHRAFTWPSD
jgi:hypothetical protein